MLKKGKLYNILFKEIIFIFYTSEELVFFWC